MGDQWRVLIIEDDPMVAKVHHRIVSDMPAFRVVAVARSAQQALRTVNELRPDLILLDLGLPGGGGLTVLRRVRAAALPVEAIAVTAAADAGVVRAALHLGVIDYLVKPFEPERLRQALSSFGARMSMLEAGSLEQPAVDVLRGGTSAQRRWVPKELRLDRVVAVREALEGAHAPLGADEVGQLLAMSRVTARRYLEYLVAIGQATCGATVGGRGRPRKLYEAVADTLVGATELMTASRP